MLTEDVSRRLVQMREVLAPAVCILQVACCAASLRGGTELQCRLGAVTSNNCVDEAQRDIFCRSGKLK